MTDGPRRAEPGAAGIPAPPWPPRRGTPPDPASRTTTRLGLLGGPPRRLVALAALAAAVLVTAGSLVVLVGLTSDFGVSLGDRLRAATGTAPLAVPLLLVVAQLALGGGPGAPAPAPQGAAVRLVPLGVAGVACAHGALLVGRALADAATLTAAPEAVGGTAGRAGDVLVALAALVLTAATGWWATREEPAG